MGIISDQQSPSVQGASQKTYNRDAATTTPPQSLMLSVEQARLEGRKLVARGTVLLNRPDMYRATVKMLKSSVSRPEELIAMAVVNIIHLMDESARKGGQDIDDRAHIAAAVGLCAEVYEIATEQSLFTLDERKMQLAVSLTIEKYIKEEIAAGRIDKDQLKADFDKSISEMTPEQKKELHQQMLNINKTAIGSRRRRRKARGRK